MIWALNLELQFQFCSSLIIKPCPNKCFLKDSISGAACLVAGNWEKSFYYSPEIKNIIWAVYEL